MLTPENSFNFGARTCVMGVVNITPDSFSGDGVMAGAELTAADIGRAVEQARRMEGEGAAVIDVGGQSSRPEHVYGRMERLSAEREAERVMPAVAAVAAAVGVPVSIDTARAEVAEAALEAGARIINDVSLLSDPAMAEAAARRGAAIIVGHTRASADYADLVRDVGDDLQRALDALDSAGVGRERIMLDPGIGFAKRAEHSIGIIGGLGRLKARFGLPLAVGISRKAFVGGLAGSGRAEDVEAAGTALAVLAIAGGADMVRTHSVAAMAAAARAADRVLRQGAGDGA